MFNRWTDKLSNRFVGYSICRLFNYIVVRPNLIFTTKGTKVITKSTKINWELEQSFCRFFIPSFLHCFIFTRESVVVARCCIELYTELHGDHIWMFNVQSLMFNQSVGYLFPDPSLPHHLTISLPHPYFPLRARIFCFILDPNRIKRYCVWSSETGVLCLILSFSGCSSQFTLLNSAIASSRVVLSK